VSGPVEAGLPVAATAFHFESAEADLLNVGAWYQLKHFLQ